MNTQISFPPSKPELKLPSHSRNPLVATPTTPPMSLLPPTPAPEPETDRAVSEDMNALREREANLRAYESHLRAWQQKIESEHPQGAQPQFVTPVTLARHTTGAPFEGDPALHAAWDKLIRARELLEAEQAHLRDDRLNLKEMAAALKRREDALSVREARLSMREEEFSSAVDASISEHTKASALARFTQAPFAIAKSVFGSKPKTEE